MSNPKQNILCKFFWWMNMRHKIYLSREAGDAFPWTEDKIMQVYKFTNVYRQLDAVTKDYTYMVNNSKNESYRDHDILFFQTVLFRSFNWPKTYERMCRSKFHLHWYPGRVKRTLAAIDAAGNKMFTGAYIIPNAGSKEKKYIMIMNAITNVWKDRKKIVKRMKEENTLQHAHSVMKEYPLYGNFIAYEIVTDLRHTPILNKAEDIMSWANPGPGAKRGINRMWRNSPVQGWAKKDRKKGEHNDDLYVDAMCYLLEISPMYLEKHMNPLEMRDIEHSLCEFDKYMRLKKGEGSVRAKFTEPAKRKLPDEV